MNDRTSPSSFEERPGGSRRTGGGSRWWYWIAAYPAFSLLSIPLAVLGFVLFVPLGMTAPMGSDSALAGPLAFAVTVLVIGGMALYAILGLVLTVLLPVALYLDATELAESAAEWSPDPILYGLVGLLNFLAAPWSAVSSRSTTSIGATSSSVPPEPATSTRSLQAIASSCRPA